MKNFFTMQVAGYAILLIALLNTACNHSTEPLEIKDPRAYTWTVDTLDYPGSFQTMMLRIWGSSPSNVYVVGDNDQPGPGTMFRFDGRRWSTTGFYATEGGSIAGTVEFIDICGFASNSVFAVGDRFDADFNRTSLIIHFNGQLWSELQAGRGDFLQCVGGADPNDLWAGGGWISSLYHIRNLQPQFIGTDSAMVFGDIAGADPSDLYAVAYRVSVAMDSTYHYLLHYDGVSWRMEDAFVETPGASPPTFGSDGLWVDGASGTFYSAGLGGVFLKTSSGWEKTLDTGPYPVLSVFGTSRSNIFAVGESRIVYHFNGSDWKQLTEFQTLTNSFYYSGVWTDGKEAFILGNDSHRSYVAHGR